MAGFNAPTENNGKPLPLAPDYIAIAEAMAADVEQAKTISNLPPAFEPPENNKKSSRGLFWAFNAASFAAGVGVSMAVKSCAVALLCTAGAGPTLTAITACAVTGALMGTLGAYQQYRRDVKQGYDAKFFTKNTFMRAYIGSMFSLLGGAAFMHLDNAFGSAITDKITDTLNAMDNPVTDALRSAGIMAYPPAPETVIPDLMDNITLAAPEISAPPQLPESGFSYTAPEINFETPALPEMFAQPEMPFIQESFDAPTAPEPVTDTVPVTEVAPEPEAAPLPDPEALTEAIETNAASTLLASLGENTDMSALAAATLANALEGDAQSIKDMAYFLFNGFEGMDVDQTSAMTLFNEAAGMGNVQAQVDLAYIEYHGLADVTANPAEAMADMQELASQDARAEWFVGQWQPN